MKTLRLWLIGGLLALLALIAFQNMASVELTVLFWSFETRRIVLIVVCFGLGAGVGWLLKAFRSRD